MVKVSGSYAQFRFFRPQAERVCLAGDFNGWRSNQIPMVRTEEGYWVAVLKLPTGSYKFRYWADGQWFCDFAAFGLEPGPLGLDSVLRIAPLEEDDQVQPDDSLGDAPLRLYRPAIQAEPAA